MNTPPVRPIPWRCQPQFERFGASGGLGARALWAHGQWAMTACLSDACFMSVRLRFRAGGQPWRGSQSEPEAHRGKKSVAPFSPRILTFIPRELKDAAAGAPPQGDGFSGVRRRTEGDWGAGAPPRHAKGPPSRCPTARMIRRDCPFTHPHAYPMTSQPRIARAPNQSSPRFARLRQQPDQTSSFPPQIVGGRYIKRSIVLYKPWPTSPLA